MGVFINIALIGCGRISKNHIKSIFIHKKLARLVAICDCNKEKIEEAKLLIHKCAKENGFNDFSFNVYRSYIRVF